MNEVEEYYLQHFGVKGMKWGVRRKRNSGPKQTRAERKTAKKSNKQAKKVAKQNAKMKNGLTRGDKIALAGLLGIGAAFGPVPLATAAAIVTYDVVKYSNKGTKVGDSPYNTTPKNQEHAKVAKQIMNDLD